MLNYMGLYVDIDGWIESNTDSSYSILNDYLIFLYNFRIAYIMLIVLLILYCNYKHKKIYT
jgi:hypothetical protein